LWPKSYDAGETTVSAVARRYSLSPQQLFAWRRAARLPSAEPAAPDPLFVPAVIAGPKSEPPAMRPAKQRKPKAADDAGVIELQTGGVAMRIGRARYGRDQAVHFRKGAEGLAALVRATVGADPFCGGVYVFRAKRADRVKLVYFYGTVRFPRRSLGRIARSLAASLQQQNQADGHACNFPDIAAQSHEIRQKNAPSTSEKKAESKLS